MLPNQVFQFHPLQRFCLLWYILANLFLHLEMFPYEMFPNHFFIFHNNGLCFNKGVILKKSSILLSSFTHLKSIQMTMTPTPLERERREP